LIVTINFMATLKPWRLTLIYITDEKSHPTSQRRQSVCIAPTNQLMWTACENITKYLNCTLWTEQSFKRISRWYT